MRREFRICIVNHALVDDIAQLVGSQADVMRRIGISWNCWIKIAGGLPIRLSVGQRLRTRLLADRARIPGFAAKFPSATAPDGVDCAALEAALLRPVTITRQERPALRPLRSVRRALALAVARSAGAAQATDHGRSIADN